LGTHTPEAPASPRCNVSTSHLRTFSSAEAAISWVGVDAGLPRGWSRRWALKLELRGPRSQAGAWERGKISATSTSFPSSSLGTHTPEAPASPRCNVSTSHLRTFSSAEAAISWVRVDAGLPRGWSRRWALKLELRGPRSQAGAWERGEKSTSFPSCSLGTHTPEAPASPRGNLSTSHLRTFISAEAAISWAGVDAGLPRGWSRRWASKLELRGPRSQAGAWERGRISATSKLERCVD